MAFIFQELSKWRKSECFDEWIIICSTNSFDSLKNKPSKVLILYMSHWIIYSTDLSTFFQHGSKPFSVNVWDLATVGKQREESAVNDKTVCTTNQYVHN